MSLTDPFLSKQKQPYKGVLRKRCSENMQQIYRRTPIPKCDFNKVALQLYRNGTSAWCSCKFAAYFQNTFPKNTSRGLHLTKVAFCSHVCFPENLQNDLKQPLESFSKCRLECRGSSSSIFQKSCSENFLRILKKILAMDILPYFIDNG